METLITFQWARPGSAKQSEVPAGQLSCWGSSSIVQACWMYDNGRVCRSATCQMLHHNAASCHASVVVKQLPALYHKHSFISALDILQFCASLYKIIWYQYYVLTEAFIYYQKHSLIIKNCLSRVILILIINVTVNILWNSHRVCRKKFHIGISVLVSGNVACHLRSANEGNTCFCW